MLIYQGNDVYQFHNEFGHPITLTRKDVNTICELAIEDPEFDIGQEMEKLADKSKHWQELYAGLVKDKETLHNDIIAMVKRHNVEEA